MLRRMVLVMLLVVVLDEAAAQGGLDLCARKVIRSLWAVISHTGQGCVSGHGDFYKWFCIAVHAEAGSGWGSESQQRIDNLRRLQNLLAHV
mmetsp:Transcript_53714/g.127980  ORF Transcript_53714/g.127980 Transcript_53714/m.127980 type:complete len:91 (-) Transcript_53714:3043-3315(-)